MRGGRPALLIPAWGCPERTGREAPRGQFSWAGSAWRLGSEGPPPRPPALHAIPEPQCKVWLLLQEAAGPGNGRMIMTSEICCSLGNNRVLSLPENCVHQLTLLSY